MITQKHQTQTQVEKVKSNLFHLYITNLNNEAGFDWLILLEYKSITAEEIRREVDKTKQAHTTLRRIQHNLQQAYSNLGE